MDMPVVGTRELLARLRADGYAVNQSYVQWLVRDAHIPTPRVGPGRSWLWTPVDEGRLCAELRRRGRAPANYGQGIQRQRLSV